MAVSNQALLIGLPRFTVTQFTITDTTAKKTLWTSGAFGSRVDTISCCSNDTAAINLQFYLKDGTTSGYLGVVNIPIGSGYTTIVKVDAIFTIANILGYLPMNPTGGTTYTLEAACLATMTTAKVLDVVCQGGDYTQQ